jgi:hypothetical protein
MNANVDRYRRFGRQGCPADVIIIICMTPGHPPRRPLITRDPDPSDSGDTNPAAVVIRSPAEILFRYPGPAIVGVYPASVEVRTPACPHRGRVPDAAVAGALDPFAVGAQSVVEDAEIDLGADGELGGDRWRWWLRDFGVHRAGPGTAGQQRGQREQCKPFRSHGDISCARHRRWAGAAVQVSVSGVGERGDAPLLRLSLVLTLRRHP